MERSEAQRRIRTLEGQNLREHADRLGVTVWKDGKLNKGWVGHTIERFLGLPLNSSRAPNFGTWELKVISLRRRKDCQLRPKETMALTMLDPVEVLAKEFEESHLFNKMRKILVVARIFENQEETRTLLHCVSEFDLDNPDTLQQVKADYDLIRATIRTKGFDSLSGKLGVLVQPRTKGTGHGSKTRAFYARTGFVAQILGI